MPSTKSIQSQVIDLTATPNSINTPIQRFSLVSPAFAAQVVDPLLAVREAQQAWDESRVAFEMACSAVNIRPDRIEKDDWHGALTPSEADAPQAALVARNRAWNAVRLSEATLAATVSAALAEPGVVREIGDAMIAAAEALADANAVVVQRRSVVEALEVALSNRRELRDQAKSVQVGNRLNRGDNSDAEAASRALAVGHALVVFAGREESHAA